MRRNEKTKGTQTIRAQILSGYFILIAVLIFLAIVSIVFLSITEIGYARTAQCREQQFKTQSVISAHYQWLEQLSDSITTGENFTGSLDPDSCALGQWIAAAKADISSDPYIKQYVEEIVPPHNEIHLEASQLIDQSKTDKDAAYVVYGQEFKPKVVEIGKGLTSISARYADIAEETASSTQALALLSKILLAVVGILAVAASIITGLRISRRISAPITAVAKWSGQLASGVDNLEFDVETLQDKRNTLEINQMISAFQDMAESIRENVRVIQKVAEGDLTAYVDIKSAGDSLGRNLYHLVQNNDFMFANLLHVADSVANNAESIASASQSLAESSTSQATAVETLSTTVNQANHLATENAKSSSDAMSVISEMKEDVRLGQEKMDKLLAAVDEIQKASEKISLVMKSINDIAFQTNILALNAAVEAARAGAAGKGFAVVADEVRNLALKSSEAASQSRVFIENTIQKATEGSQISAMASDTFAMIVDCAAQVTQKVEEISAASLSQQHYMSEIHEEIEKISSVVVENAASSEQTAAATQQMTSNAELIRQEMYKFNLRKREEGKPYIPPEKANDEEFVRLAYENYQKAVRRVPPNAALPK